MASSNAAFDAWYTKAAPTIEQCKGICEYLCKNVPNIITIMDELSRRGYSEFSSYYEFVKLVATKKSEKLELVEFFTETFKYSLGRYYPGLNCTVYSSTYLDNMTQRLNTKENVGACGLGFMDAYYFGLGEGDSDKKVLSDAWDQTRQTRRKIETGRYELVESDGEFSVHADREKCFREYFIAAATKAGFDDACIENGKDIPIPSKRIASSWYLCALIANPSSFNYFSEQGTVRIGLQFRRSDRKVRYGSRRRDEYFSFHPGEKFQYIAYQHFTSTPEMKLCIDAQMELAKIFVPLLEEASRRVLDGF